MGHARDERCRGLGAIGVPAHAALTAAVTIGICSLLVVGVLAAISMPQTSVRNAAGGPVRQTDRLLPCADLGDTNRCGHSGAVSGPCSGSVRTVSMSIWPTHLQFWEGYFSFFLHSASNVRRNGGCLMSMRPLSLRPSSSRFRYCHWRLPVWLDDMGCSQIFWLVCSARLRRRPELLSPATPAKMVTGDPAHFCGRSGGDCRHRNCSRPPEIAGLSGPG